VPHNSVLLSNYELVTAVCETNVVLSATALALSFSVACRPSSSYTTAKYSLLLHSKQSSRTSRAVQVQSFSFLSKQR
jgi:hypothetical protein